MSGPFGHDKFQLWENCESLIVTTASHCDANHCVWHVTGWIGCLDAHWEQVGPLLCCVDRHTCCLGADNLPLLVMAPTVPIELDRVANDPCVDLLVLLQQELKEVLESRWFCLELWRERNFKFSVFPGRSKDDRSNTKVEGDVVGGVCRQPIRCFSASEIPCPEAQKWSALNGVVLPGLHSALNCEWLCP